MVANIYEHTDYRSFLREWFEEEKKRKSFMSYRYLSRRVEIDPGFLVHIFQGTKHLSEAAIPRMAQELKFDAIQLDYFRELVLFNRARGPRQIKEHFQRLCQMRDVQSQEIASRQYRYYLKWYYPAVRVALLAIPLQRGQEDSFATRMDPCLSRPELDEAIQMLLELNLAKWSQDDFLEPVSPFLTTGDRWKDNAVRGFQEQTMELARRSLTEHSPACREVSTLTLAIPESEIPTLQEMVKDFRQRVLQWTASLEEADAVMQVNVATFPLTRLTKADKR
jgi:uncharacterized protein (TIGR02147 family)